MCAIDPLRSWRSGSGQGLTDFSAHGYQTSGGASFLSRSSEGVDDVHYDRGTRGEVLAVRRGSDPNPVQRYRYDARMRVDTIVDAGNHVTAFFYDGNTALNLDSVRTVTADGNQRTAYTYDAHGRTSTVRDPQNTVLTTTYDLLNRVEKVRIPGDSVRYAYLGGDSVVVTDAAGKRYTSLFNRLGWAVAERDPAGRTTTVGYDSAGNAVRTVDRQGRVFTAQHDAMGRVTSLATPDGTTTWGFDNPAGRWTWVSNAESTDTVQMDAAGRPSTIVSHMGGQRFTVSSAYDLAGRRTGVGMSAGPLYTPAWSRDVEYQYDGYGRLTAMGEVGGALATVGYNAEDLPSTITWPNGLTSLTFGYTTRHQVSSAQYGTSGLNGTFGTGIIAYDLLDRVTSRSNTAGTRQRTYAYDPQGRLEGYQEQKWVTYPPPPFCEGQATSEVCLPFSGWDGMRIQAWSYDAVGNSTQASYTDSAGTTLSWSAALQAFSNRYARYGAATDSLLYDSLGNLVRRRVGAQVYEYQWNSLGQLTGVNVPGTGWVYYGYNGLGMRVRRTAGGVTTRFVYDGDDLGVEVDASGNRIRSYTYWPGVDQPFSMRTWESGQNGAVYYYALDLPSNSVRGLFNASGTITHRYEYDPFGRVLSASGGVTNPLRFAARELDPSTGLYYVRARWYDPVQGRFISEDPIGLGGGINNYAYALNDPVNLGDPSGLCVGEKYDADRTVCVLDPISSVAPPWYSSMIDQVFGLGGRESAFAGMTIGGWNDDGSGPGPIERVAEEEDGFLERAGKCALDHYGLGALVGGTGAAAVAAGAPVLPYPRSGVDAGQSTGRTSLLSRAARRIPGQFTSSRWAPTLRNLGARTMSKGAFVARWVPWVGGAMLVVDAAFITACAVSQGSE